MKLDSSSNVDKIDFSHSSISCFVFATFNLTEISWNDFAVVKKVNHFYEILMYHKNNMFPDDLWDSVYSTTLIVILQNFHYCRDPKNEFFSRLSGEDIKHNLNKFHNVYRSKSMSMR